MALPIVRPGSCPSSTAKGRIRRFGSLSLTRGSSRARVWPSLPSDRGELATTITLASCLAVMTTSLDESLGAIKLNTPLRVYV